MTKVQAMIAALIFDFDGLILDTESSMFETWQEIYAEHNLEFPHQEWANMLGTSSDPQEAYAYLEQHLRAPVDRDQIRARRVARELAILRDRGPMPGIRPLIEECLTAGISLAIASSSEHAWVDEHLRRLDLSGDFSVVVCADDVLRTKPEPDLYLRALDLLQLSSAQAIALEDSEHGVRAARAAGLFCIAVPNEVTKVGTFTEADRVLDSLEGVRLRDILALASEG
jgi:HAD superfamily hydrolase (TIGR01509 family)